MLPCRISDKYYIYILTSRNNIVKFNGKDMKKISCFTLLVVCITCFSQPNGNIDELMHTYTEIRLKDSYPPEMRGIGKISNIQTTLTSNFTSSKLVDFVKSDRSCLGYFGYAGAPGQPKYVSVCRNNADFYEIKFIRYNFKYDKLEVAKASEISEDTAEVLLSILKEQIAKRQDYVQGIFDGAPYEFGIRKAGHFDCAGVNPSDAVSIIRVMCNIANTGSVKDIEELLKKWESEFVECVNDKFVSLNLSKETAVKLAETTLVSIYGADVLRQKPWIVEENARSFKIMGRPTDRMLGGVAEIEIRRSDGKVMRCEYGK